MKKKVYKLNDLTEEEFEELRQIPEKILKEKLMKTADPDDPVFKELYEGVQKNIETCRNPNIEKGEKKELLSNLIANIEITQSKEQLTKEPLINPDVSKYILGIYTNELKRVERLPDLPENNPEFKVKSIYQKIILLNELGIIDHLKKVCNCNNTTLSKVINLLTKEELKFSTVRQSITHLKSGKDKKDPYYKSQNFKDAKAELLLAGIDLDEINKDRT